MSLSATSLLAEKIHVGLLSNIREMFKSLQNIMEVFTLTSCFPKGGRKCVGMTCKRPLICLRRKNMSPICLSVKTVDNHFWMYGTHAVSRVWQVFDGEGG